MVRSGLVREGSSFALIWVHSEEPGYEARVSLVDESLHTVSIRLSLFLLAGTLVQQRAASLWRWHQWTM